MSSSIHATPSCLFQRIFGLHPEDAKFMASLPKLREEATAAPSFPGDNGPKLAVSPDVLSVLAIGKRDLGVEGSTFARTLTAPRHGASAH